MQQTLLMPIAKPHRTHAAHPCRPPPHATLVFLVRRNHNMFVHNLILISTNVSVRRETRTSLRMFVDLVKAERNAVICTSSYS